MINWEDTFDGVIRRGVKQLLKVKSDGDDDEEEDLEELEVVDE